MSAVLSTDLAYDGPILDAAAVAAMDLGDEKQRAQLHNFMARELLQGEESCVFEVVQAVTDLQHHHGVNGMTVALVLDRVRRSIAEVHSTAQSNLALMQSLHNGHGDDATAATAVTATPPSLPPLPNIEALLVDAIWVADAEIDEMEPSEETKKKRWAALVQLITMLKGQGLLTEPMMQERFGIDLLSRALPRFPAKAFETECIRRRTKMIYKQQKFNLLREESEGYAKLVTELVRDMPKNGASTAVLEQQAKDTLLRLQSLIGYFDLDPNRVLDIVLDIFAYNLLRYHAYFLTLLRASPWYETRERPTNVTGQPPAAPGQAVMVNVFAQLMGQKFAYYSRWQQEHPDRPTRTPEEITFAAALLIREGFMSVDELLPHLTPTMEDTKDEYKRYLQDKIDGLRNARLNVLARADLCAALLAIGELHGATRLLALHPYLPAIRANVALSLGRIVDHLIEPLYAPVRPVPYRRIVPAGRPDYTWDILATGNSVFFYTPWADRLDEHRLQPGEEDGSCMRGLRRYLSLLHLGLSKCPALLAKLCRIAVHDLASQPASEHSMQSDDDDERRIRKKNTWMHIIREYLLPAISCMRANPAVLHELWLLLEQYSYEQRFGMYGEWTIRYGENTRLAKATKEPACMWGLILARAKTESAVKDIMQRISSETVKESGRRLAKASHAAPTIAFRAVMFQLRTYDNMTQSVTDAFKYLSRFGYDVLTYTIIDLFANGQERLQQDGQHISTWLRNLASFCGQAIRRYSAVSSEAIAQYIVNQIRKGNTSDLFILEQIIKEVASMEAGAIFTEHQLYAAGGGEILRREALISGLGIVLAVLMGQLRRDMVYTSEQDFLDNLKVLGSRYDQLSGQLLQYAEFFRECTPPAEYDATLPELDVLCMQYGLEPEVAFHWLRPKYHRQLKKRLAAADAAKETDGQADSMQVDPPAATPSEHLLLTPDMEVMIRALLPSDVWEHISPSFYMTFWQLSMYDIHVPEAQYAVQERTLRDERQDIERGHRDTKGLRVEMDMHKKHVAAVMRTLEQEKRQWFSHAKDPRQTAAYVFQYCLRPRLLFSDVDALYCFKFVETMHRLAVPGLWTLGLYNAVLRRSLSNWIFSCTEKEAKRLGQYMKHILAKLTRWHMKEGEFAKEGTGEGWPGFAKRPCTNRLQVVPVPEQQRMSLDELTLTMITWHRYLHETFADCLASGEYMQIRNAISILTEILEYFPLIDRPGRIMQSDYVRRLQEDERNDLRILAIGYYAKLKHKSSTWITIDAFKKRKRITILLGGHDIDYGHDARPWIVGGSGLLVLTGSGGHDIIGTGIGHGIVPMIRAS
ncbi:transcription factor/nuclear export subunit protein 2-domain-containing protein [Syncephalis pseudoplumigaleata]|uniref:THO complex subunit 2 n=1 Tax=Syncephalis pseudoplumigaleata TaxID=1712513 RepID=A0A4P9Z5H2_9FUNG|nr:transcription factor/nuclear export subunit protein 2-domain-containing protein [Syncephalis pseudoplumigaleata]|eukprot:RKP27765.1 transcription factor/nuclear export subunit protein 2-domain-containing protein [Syncephalis pseudoplumigaleata]